MSSPNELELPLGEGFQVTVRLSTVGCPYVRLENEEDARYPIFTEEWGKFETVAGQVGAGRKSELFQESGYVEWPLIPGRYVGIEKFVEEGSGALYFFKDTRKGERMFTLTETQWAGLIKNLSEIRGMLDTLACVAPGKKRKRLGLSSRGASPKKINDNVLFFKYRLVHKGACVYVDEGWWANRGLCHSAAILQEGTMGLPEGSIVIKSYTVNRRRATQLMGDILRAYRQQYKVDPDKEWLVACFTSIYNDTLRWLPLNTYGPVLAECALRWMVKEEGPLVADDDYPAFLQECLAEIAKKRPPLQ